MQFISELYIRRCNLKVYLKDNEGLVHLTSVGSGHEYTLCGSPFDNDIYGDPMEAVKIGPVTCVLCIVEIENCRNVKCRIE